MSYEVKYDKDGKTRSLNDRVGFAKPDVASQNGSFQLLNKQIATAGRIVEARAWLHDKWATEPVDSEWVRQEERVDSKGIGWRMLSPLLGERHPNEFVDGHRQLRRYLCLDYHDPTLGSYFELAISYLLGSTGFSMLFLGKPIAKKGIDIVAISTASNEVLAVSVHVSNDIHEKLRTLIPEVNRLKGLLPDMQILPAVFSPVSYKDILSSDNMSARDAGVALILRDHIEDLFRIASTSAPPEATQKALELFQRALDEQAQRSPGMA